MKIVKFFKAKSYFTFCIFAILCFLNEISQISCDCTIKKGCLTRKKFMSYVTIVNKDGKPIISRSIMNYKIVYVFTDRLVFYTSLDSGSASLEQETEVEEKEQESKIERIINYGEVILDCGKYKNKLCHAQEYRGIEKISSFKIPQKIIPNNPDALCILIPFFENGYEKIHDKIAYICGTEAKDMYNIISFKQYLSRQIEKYQLIVSLDRYNGFNGLLRKQMNVVLKTNVGAKSGYAKIFNKGINFYSDTKLIKNYSFYQLRKHAHRAMKVKEGLVLNKIPKDWNQGFQSSPPLPECCIYLDGEQDKITFCLATQNGELESAVDICTNKIDKIFREIQIALRGIFFSESYHEIYSNKFKANNCAGDDFKVFQARARKTVEYSVETDCKFVMNYVNSDDYKKKYDWCQKNFADELKLEIQLMSLSSNKVLEILNRCVYNFSPEYKKFFSNSYFIDLMKRANLIENKFPSFVELSLSTEEHDDYDEDDEEVSVHNKNTKSNLRNNHSTSYKSGSNKESTNINKNEDLSEEEIYMLQTKKEKVISDNNNDKDLLYNKPNENKSNLELQRAQIFRNTQMASLQSTHTFRHSSRENINESFNRGRSSLGKENADEFVSFLGYLRDASFRASQLVALKEEKKLQKLSKKDQGQEEKKSLSVNPPKYDENSNKKDPSNQYVPTSSIKYAPEE